MGFLPAGPLTPQVRKREDSDLRLVGSDSYLAEVFPVTSTVTITVKQMTIRATNIAFAAS